jgi:hypothetical protein
MGLDVDMDGRRRDVHDFAGLADFHVQVDCQYAAGGDGHRALKRSESRQFGGDRVLAGRERRRRERAIAAGSQVALRASRRMADGNRDTGTTASV